MSRTFKARRGRVTKRQSAALTHARDPLIDGRPWDEITAGWADVVLEIGFGTGAPTAAMAASQPDLLVVACDVHTPGVGDLLARIADDGLGNVRVFEGDALILLREVVPVDALAGVRAYFPDPWPKARHHKRRLVQGAHVELISSRVRPGGIWHLATDWTPYAEEMVDVIGRHGWQGGVIDRPDWRPVTRYEQLALDAGRPVVDLLFTRC